MEKRPKRHIFGYICAGVLILAVCYLALGTYKRSLNASEAEKAKYTIEYNYDRIASVPQLYENSRLAQYLGEQRLERWELEARVNAVERGYCRG